jgi:hypothetical protein
MSRRSDAIIGVIILGATFAAWALVFYVAGW